VGAGRTFEEPLEVLLRGRAEHGEGAGKIAQPIGADGGRGPAEAGQAAVDGGVPEGAVAVPQEAFVRGTDPRRRQVRFVPEMGFQHVGDVGEFVAQELEGGVRRG